MGTDAAPGGEQMTIEDTESNVYELSEIPIQAHCSIVTSSSVWSCSGQ